MQQSAAGRIRKVRQMLLNLLTGAVLFFPAGIVVGYWWRHRISRARRARYLDKLNLTAREYMAERNKAALETNGRP
jgi:hypothetical protein